MDLIPRRVVKLTQQESALDQAVLDQGRVLLSTIALYCIVLYCIVLYYEYGLRLASHWTVDVCTRWR